jgi:XTP/dITP diphosphohydrolase
MERRLLVATHNAGKVAEYAHMLADFAIRWLSLGDVGVEKDVEETGRTFRENAVLKASTYAGETGFLTLGDDSGLEVEALNGEPGIFTARYGGKDLSHAQRYQLLLKKLHAVTWEDRGARFRAVIALARPDGVVVGTAEGVCRGKIAFAPAGAGGFGYDPVFYLPELRKTMAELEADVKNQISHRARALHNMEPLLREVLSSELP